MPNPNRFNPRNAALGEANTKLVLASLKVGPRSVADLMIVTGLTRPTILKKLEQNKDSISIDHNAYPKKYYLKGIEYKTVIDEVVAENKEHTSSLEATKQAILHGTQAALGTPVFFPDKTHNDFSILHDQINNSDDTIPLHVMYRSIEDTKGLARVEQGIKMFYDLLQFRKTLKEWDKK